jgi:hypothetical protein
MIKIILKVIKITFSAIRVQSASRGLKTVSDEANNYTEGDGWVVIIIFSYFMS